jgi:hypothetical protein
MYRLESCVCSFLHALFSHGVFGMEFFVRRTHVGCEGQSSQPDFELYCASSCMRVATRSCSTGHNLVAEGLLLGEPIFIWANSP